MDRSKPDDDPDRWVLTATIIPSDAVQTLAGIHDRNPVILPEHMWLHWLDPSLVGGETLVDEAVHAGVAESIRTRVRPGRPPSASAPTAPELLEPLPQ